MEQLPNGYTLELSDGCFPLSTDSMLLAHFAKLPRYAQVLDLGSGCGTLGLLLCAGDPNCTVTGVELTAGFLFNRSHSIWDYRQLPYNIKGQICLPFCLLWVPVGQAGIWIYEKIDRIFPEKPQKPLEK